MKKKVTLFCFIFLIQTSITSVAQNKTSNRVNLKGNDVAGVSVLTQEMMSKSATTYVINDEFDLDGKTLLIPQGCNLIFKKRGSISNGVIVFNNTWLRNERFYRIKSAKGLIINNSFDAFRYDFIDDTDKLLFLLNQAKDGYLLRLEAKTYHINTLKGVVRVGYDTAFAAFKEMRNVSIIGNNTVFEDSASKTLIGKFLYSVLQFDACKNVKIAGISYVWDNEAILHPKVEGIIFLRTFNECSGFDVEVKIRNAGRGVYSGKWNDVGDPGRGICDSRLSIEAIHVGYPLAIEKGDNLDIFNHFEYAHRGTYLAGVTNSRVFVEGKEAYSTGVNLFLTDTSDSNGCYFCDNITATIIDTGTKEMVGSVIMAQCNTYPQSYDQFRGRKPYDVKDIKIAITTPIGSTTSYEGFLYSDLAQIGDTMNIMVTGDMADEGENSRLTRLRDIPYGEITFRSVQSAHNYIIIHSDVSDGCNIFFEDCPNIEVTIPSQQRKTTGTITFQGCSFRRFTKSDNSDGNFYPRVMIK